MCFSDFYPARISLVRTLQEKGAEDVSSIREVGGAPLSHEGRGRLAFFNKRGGRCTIFVWDEVGPFANYPDCKLFLVR